MENSHTAIRHLRLAYSDRTKSWLEVLALLGCDLTFISPKKKYKIIMFQKFGSKILTGKGLGLLGGAGAAAFVGTRYIFCI